MKPRFFRVPSAGEKKRRWAEPPTTLWNELRDISIEVTFRVTVAGASGLALTLDDWLGLLIRREGRVPESMTPDAAR